MYDGKKYIDLERISVTIVTVIAWTARSTFIVTAAATIFTGRLNVSILTSSQRKGWRPAHSSQWDSSESKTDGQKAENEDDVHIGGAAIVRLFGVEACVEVRRLKYFYLEIFDSIVSSEQV